MPSLIETRLLDTEMKHDSRHDLRIQPSFHSQTWYKFAVLKTIIVLG
jgi:hypothetical protein